MNINDWIIFFLVILPRPNNSLFWEFTFFKDTLCIKKNRGEGSYGWGGRENRERRQGDGKKMQFSIFNVWYERILIFNDNANETFVLEVASRRKHSYLQDF
ncbi:unnamed protein product [Prunus brigantina]